MKVKPLSYFLILIFFHFDAIAFEPDFKVDEIKQNGSKTFQRTMDNKPYNNPTSKSCEDKGTQANQMCLESTSPKIATAVAAINLLMSGASTMGLADACAKYNKAMNVASAALTAFSAECTYFKYQCESACEEDKHEIESEIARLRASCTTGACAAVQAQIAKLQSELVFVNGMTRECNSYKLQIASAGAGIFKLVKNAQDAKKCQDQTQTNVVDCGKSENYQNIKCICERTPRAPGCPGALPGDGTQNYTASVVGTSGNTQSISQANGDTSGMINNDTSGGLGTNNYGNSGGGGGSASGGGVAGSLGGSGSGARGVQQKSNGADGGKGSGFNTNVINGDFGGGGGGGYGRGSGSGSNPYADSAYRAYMPGGSKDPTRALASQKQVIDVTGAGGEDNFAKVNARYRDNRPSLGD